MIEWKAPDGKRSARNQGSPEQETGCGEAAKAREKGVYYLQFSSKTEEEMRRKLAEQGFSPASVDSAVKFLKERRYLNDEDYARRYLEKNGKKKSRKQRHIPFMNEAGEKIQKASVQIADGIPFIHVTIQKIQDPDGRPKAQTFHQAVKLADLVICHPGA